MSSVSIINGGAKDLMAEQAVAANGLRVARVNVYDAMPPAGFVSGSLSRGQQTASLRRAEVLGREQRSLHPGAHV